MSDLFEDAKPYPESSIWELQKKYYQKGKSLWKDNDIPYYVSNNKAFSNQNIQVLLAYIQSKNLKELKILELGAGSGIFALNFITDLQKLTDCKIIYYITDYSETNLKDLLTSKQFDNLPMEMLVLDVYNPLEIRSLSGETTKIFDLDLIIVNYVFCNIPPNFIKYEQGKYYEKYVELAFRDTSENRDTIMNESFSKVVLSKLEIRELYKEIDLDTYFPNSFEQSFFSEYSRDQNYGVINYPAKILKSLKPLLSALKNDGLMLISDSAMADRDQYKDKGFRDNIHGNSISNYVNFPFLESYLSYLGLSSLRTMNPLFVFHSMLIQKNPTVNSTVTKRFQHYFCDNNLNNHLVYQQQLAKEYLKQDRFDEAFEIIKAIYNYLPDDPLILHFMGFIFLKQNKIMQAIKFFHKGKQQDKLKLYDFDFNLSTCFQLLGKLDIASSYLKESLNNHTT